MTRQQRHADRPLHEGQRGFTLIELLVSLSILAVIGGVMAAAFGVGFKVVGTGGSGSRLAGSHDLMVFEQVLSADVSRSSCIYVPDSSTQPYGSCTNLFATGQVQRTCDAWAWNGQSARAVLCLAWPQPSDGSCHVAIYGFSTGGPTVNEVRRQEYAISTSSPTVLSVVGGRSVTTVDQPAVSMSVSGVDALGTPSGGTWVSQLEVTVTSSGLANPPDGPFILRPLVQDPAALAPSSGYPLC